MFFILRKKNHNLVLDVRLVLGFEEIKGLCCKSWSKQIGENMANVINYGESLLFHKKSFKKEDWK